MREWMQVLRAMLACAIFAVVVGCAATPLIDRSWINQNCSATDWFAPDSCAEYDYCEYAGSGRCTCYYSNGQYTGTLKDGKRHGAGQYTWKNGTLYSGYWYDGERLCGMESTGHEYILYRNGSIAQRGQHSSGNGWADILAAAVVVGGAAYIIAEHGGSGYSQTDYAWDYMPGNDQWVCRSTRTGRFAELENCRNKPVNDNRWPN